MQTRLARRPHVLLVAFAALGTLGLMQLPQSSADEPVQPRATASDRAMTGLMDAGSAAEAGSWWLDDPSTTASLSFDPDHDRLVWRVSGSEGRVLLDAETGDALEFEFDRS